jgi:hypothetical protein
MVLLLCSAVSALGSSVLQTSMVEMFDSSELVFEGVVADVETRADDAEATIHTYVRFEVLDVLKGEWAQETIEIRFLGGRLGEMSLHVSESNIPSQNERGIYFIESLERFQVNPIFGWAQGHFVLNPDESGILRVHTFSGDPVVGLGAATTPGARAPSSGVALGVRLKEPELQEVPLDSDQFKSLIRKLGDPQRD